MDREKENTVAVAREFFANELRHVLEKRQVKVQGVVFEYLVELLVHFIQSETFFARSSEGKLEDNYLVKLYADCVHGSVETKRQALKRLGDVCLMVTGFFSDSLNRKLVDVDYYFGMGGAAYWQLSQNGVSRPIHLFRELSVKFKTVSNVLNEVSDRGASHSNQDVLRLYERWVHTRSEHLKEILSSKGIKTPVVIELKTRH